MKSNGKADMRPSNGKYYTGYNRQGGTYFGRIAGSRIKNPEKRSFAEPKVTPRREGDFEGKPWRNSNWMKTGKAK